VAGFFDSDGDWIIRLARDPPGEVHQLNEVHQLRQLRRTMDEPA
jgi:hypothetical protein